MVSFAPEFIENAKKVACPVCDAKAGESCVFAYVAGVTPYGVHNARTEASRNQENGDLTVTEPESHPEQEAMRVERPNKNLSVEQRVRSWAVANGRDPEQIVSLWRKGEILFPKYEQQEPAEQWVYGAEARAAALAAGRSDCMEVTGWPLHLEQAHDAAVEAVTKAKLALRNAERAEIAAQSAIMATDAVQKRPLEPQPYDEGTGDYVTAPQQPEDFLMQQAAMQAAEDDLPPLPTAEATGQPPHVGPHSYKGNRSMDTCWVEVSPGELCRKPLEDPIHAAQKQPEEAMNQTNCPHPGCKFDSLHIGPHSNDNTKKDA